MCNANCIIFGATNLSEAEVRGKKVVELGSRDVNGSLRRVVELLKPSEYVGLDMEAGPGVDMVCGAEEAAAKLGAESFDVVISTEMLEHVRDWRRVISNVKRLCRPGGIILLTTRSVGAEYHSYPSDFWRYDPGDMEFIFSDCEIKKLERDSPEAGVFLKAVKPAGFREKDLSGYGLYSIIEQKRILEVNDAVLKGFYRRMNRYQRIRDSVYAAGKFVAAKILRI
ncbi:MAG: methyltransferase type 11 [Elusimicrobia bacterium GWA2_62_23]|nr:MAG: methyltransferase type 11 [Elusimicrobia bacterium GWA2_62_23]HBB65910.1 methyltransferase type 11 [Elusimicrobiota bacterium]